MRQKREWGADEADDPCADKAVFGCLSGIRALRSNEADDDAAGDHAGDPCGMVIALGGCLRPGLSRPVTVNAENLSAIESEASIGRIAGRVTEQVGVSDSGEEAVDGAVVYRGDDHGLPILEVLQAAPRRVSRRSRRGREFLSESRSCKRGESEKCNRKVFHARDLRASWRAERIR